jgi:ABC-2 type transport system permease protein
VVGLVVRLRLAMWWTAMSRSSLHLVSSIIGGLAALAVLGVMGPALVLLAFRPLRMTALTVPMFAFVTLMWGVLSIVATGVDNVLDPARFSVLPLRSRDLARGLLAAAYTGIPALLLCGLALAQVAAWGGHPAALPAALLAAVLGTVTAVLLSRAATSLLARVMTNRTGRMVGALVVSLVTLLPLVLNLVLTTGSVSADLASFDATRSATVASWTPVGWAWGLPFDVAAGRWGAAAVHAILAVALIALLWRVWVRQLERSLTSPMTTGGGQRIGRGRVLPVLLGGSPTATIAARRIRAWYRDSRLVGIALRTAVLPVFFVLQAVFTRTNVFAGVGVVTLAVFAGLTLMNDLAFDGPAWWIHVATGVRGWEDRLGRAVASTVVFGPMVLATFVVSVALGVITSVLPWLTVVTVSFLASLGLAVGVGAVLPGTAPRTGGNPFAATSGGAAQGCLTATISFVGPVVLTLPVVVLAVLTSGSPPGRWVALVVGLGYGAAILAAGVVLGGRRLDRRSPELLGQLAHAQL